jgi:uncharacterized coiled-coil DUF342 family protein
MQMQWELELASCIKEEFTMSRKISDLRKAEEKYRALLDKRDKLNAEALEIRKVRDMLNAQKSSLLHEALEIRKSIAEKAAVLHEHKEKRNEYNRKAKELIALKKELSKNSPGTDAFREMERLTREFEQLELRQQTESMSIAEENKLIERMRTLLNERSRLMDISRKSQEIAGKLTDLDVQIDTLFTEARKEHEALVSLYSEIRGLEERMKQKLDEASIVTGEADRKHRDYLTKKEEADRAHREAMEMRSLILEIRKERKEAYLEGRRAIEEHNETARKLLLDDEASSRQVEKQLEELLKKGKISLR